jgi:hypothetical protein
MFGISRLLLHGFSRDLALLVEKDVFVQERHSWEGYSVCFGQKGLTYNHLLVPTQ